jgi:hypothetical protein
MDLSSRPPRVFDLEIDPSQKLKRSSDLAFGEIILQQDSAAPAKNRTPWSINEK